MEVVQSFRRSFYLGESLRVFCIISVGILRHFIVFSKSMRADWHLMSGTNFWHDSY